MRKEIKSKSKRKWIVGGAMLFGGIALLTTGFATWIVGTQVKDQQGQTTVTIDTVDNQTLILTATLSDNTLHIGETGITSSNEDFYPVTAVGGDATDFSITIDIKIVKSKSASVVRPTSVTIALDTTYVNEAANVVKSLGGATGQTPMVHAGTDFLKLKTESILIDDSKWLPNSEGTMETYEANETIQLLDWGNFFGDVAPTSYYKAQYDALLLSNPNYGNLAGDDYSKFTAAAETELKQMHSKFSVESKDTIIPLKLSI